MKKSKLARLLATACCFAMLLTACSSPTPSESESTPPSSTGADTEEKVLTFAIGAETTSLSTLYMNNSLCCTSKLVYENLVDFANGEIVPGLAESWEYNDDQTELTFYLRQGVTSVSYTHLDVYKRQVPYFAVAKMVNLLISAEKNFSIYLTWGMVALIAYLLKSVLHGISTRCSHEATFHVLSELRRAVADKLTHVSMGYLTDTPSGRLKTTMVERCLLYTSRCV